MRFFRIVIVTIIYIGLIFGLFWIHNTQNRRSDSSVQKVVKNINKSTPTPTPSPTPIPIPQSYIIPLQHHTFQTYNNCGPASLSMALSYYGINVSQHELGQDLRPYQVASGDNDDKSVTLAELSQKAQEMGFITYHRPNGNMDILKRFISNDMPVIVRTWTQVNEDIGHFRVVRGYTDTQIVQDDSLQGKNLYYSYNEFNQLWDKFNFEYLVLVPDSKQNLAQQIIGEDVDEEIAWQNAVELSQKALSENPNDIDARFNLSVAYYHIGEYQKSVDEFEKVENQLPFRTLWYQIEPIKSYYELGNYQRVFAITDQVLNNHNRAFSELYIIRGDIYKAQNNLEAARAEYEKAVLYNKNLDTAQERLNMLN